MRDSRRTSRARRTVDRCLSRTSTTTCARASGATAELVAEHAAQSDRDRCASSSAASSLRAAERACASTAAQARARLRSHWRRSSARSCGVDIVPELLERARQGAPANVTFVEGDATELPFEAGSFDLACSRADAASHRAPRAGDRRAGARDGAPAVASSSTTRSRRPDPLAAFELDRFERARDPSHTRTLPDVDFRQLFEANGPRPRSGRSFQTHRRKLDYYPRSRRLRGRCPSNEQRSCSPGGPDGLRRRERLVSPAAKPRLGTSSASGAAEPRNAAPARAPARSPPCDTTPRHERLALVAR